MAPTTDVLLQVGASPRVSLAVQATTPVVSMAAVPRVDLVLAAQAGASLSVEATVEAL